MKHASRRLRAALAGLSAVVAVAAQAAPHYRLTDLGANTLARGINAGGEVVGLDASAHAATWRRGTWTPLPLLPGGVDDSATLRITRSGAVLGNEVDAHLFSTSIVWTKAGKPVPLFHDPHASSTAYDIADDGTVVGSIVDPRGGPGAFAYTWQHGVAQRVPAAPWGTDVLPTVIDASHRLAGESVVDGQEELVLFSDGAWRVLGSLGGSALYAFQMNVHGQIVGTANLPDGGSHAFLWDGQALQDLGAPGGGASTARGINRHGTIVGWTAAPQADAVAFVWSDDAMQDLNTLVTDADGWTLGSADGIDDAGLIVGNGSVGGVPHAFLLTPAGR
jgi:probable HAF family extracellular repeat protein